MALLQEILKNNKKAQGSEAQEEDKCIGSYGKPPKDWMVKRYTTDHAASVSFMNRVLEDLG